ncbi:hypothetical protein GJAV_G00214890 [Gymnothorax javanicus]|nr:hypothetical protein GJAV_G00214890 [Gymnothorax javanicus]
MDDLYMHVSSFPGHMTRRNTDVIIRAQKERLMVAVREILEVVGDTVSEYQEETARTHRENESLRRKLREVVIEAESDWTAPLPPSLSATEGRPPLEQRCREQEWSTSLREDFTAQEENEELHRVKGSRRGEEEWSIGLREELRVREEEQDLGEPSRSRQKEEDAGGTDGVAETDTGSEPPPQGDAAPGLKKLALEIALSVVSPASLTVSHELGAVSAAEVQRPGHSRSAPPSSDCWGTSGPPETPSEAHVSSVPETSEAGVVGHLDGSEIGCAQAGHPEDTEPLETGTRITEIQTDGYFIGYRGEKPHRCFQCGKFFSQICNLKTHLQIHTGERPYACTWCGKSFIQSADLRRHQRIHTGEKPHRCSWCEKSFTQVGNLKRHLRIHTGERPYCCNLCGKSFNNGDTLKKHERVHTGERPFRCAHCSKTFTVASSLQSHLRNHLKGGRQ